MNYYRRTIVKPTLDLRSEVRAISLQNKLASKMKKALIKNHTGAKSTTTSGPLSKN